MRPSKAGKKWSPAAAFTAQVNANRCSEAFTHAVTASEQAHTYDDWAAVVELFKTAASNIPKPGMVVNSSQPCPTVDQVETFLQQASNSCSEAQIREAKEKDAAAAAARKNPPAPG